MASGSLWCSAGSGARCSAMTWMNGMGGGVEGHPRGKGYRYRLSSVQSLGHVWLCDPRDRSTPGLPVHHQLPELAQTHVYWVDDAIHHLILCRPLLLPPSIFPSVKVFLTESVLCIRWPEYWSFSFSISPPNEYSGLISFRINWLDLLAVQATLKNLLQHHSSKASVL